MNKPNLTRPVQLIIRVTPEEKLFIYEKKMPLLRTKNFNAYARKMLIDGYVINIDLSRYHELANEVNKIGVNINQIAHIANASGNISAGEIENLQERIDEIWQLLKSSLSGVQSVSR